MKTYLIALSTLLVVSCKTNSQEKGIQEKFSLDNKHKEISGMVYHKETDKIWMLQDKGNASELYAYTKEGVFAQTLTINQQENTDWEDLSQDVNGNLYIGNFGNNANDRQDLSILKIDHSQLNESRITVSQTTTFNYEDQKDFPPKKSQLLYDCEAFVTTKDAFYLFTKNRAKGFDGTFFVYKIPNKEGHFTAKKIATLTTCGQYRTCAITGASINAEENEIALLTHDKVLIIPFHNDESFQQNAIKEYNLGHQTQKEAITYLDNETLFIADEKEKGADGGKVYVLGLH